MKFNFPKLNPPPLPKPEVNKLKKLAKSNINISFTKTNYYLNVPQYKISIPRDIDELILDIANGENDNLSLLEWIYCLHFKEEWNRKHPHNSKPTSEVIWKVAEYNDWLKQRLFWRLALYYSGDRDLLPLSLVKTFSIFTADNEIDSIRIEIVNSLRQNLPEEIARLSWEQVLTPQELLKSYQLPDRIPASSEALDYVVSEFSSSNSPNEQQIEWLFCCFQEMSDLQKQKNAKNIDCLEIRQKILDFLEKS
ncbi:MAG: hypothetical protein QNJ54_13730 [Prochloraceae cyanobacterium]|nr:hypothetical protein [Prochloraceae cyanobacterium]